MDKSTKVITFRPPRDLEEWLRSQPNRSEVINAALYYYRQGIALSDEVTSALAQQNVTLEEIKNLLKGESNDESI